MGPIYLKGRSHRYYIWVGADRQRIAKFGGSFIRHRITPLNVSRSRHVQRRLVAVPVSTAGRERRERMTLAGGDRGARRLFSRPIRGVSDIVTSANSWTPAAEERERTSPQASRTAWTSATNLSDALSARGDKD